MNNKYYIYESTLCRVPTTLSGQFSTARYFVGANIAIKTVSLVTLQPKNNSEWVEESDYCPYWRV